MTIPPAPQTTPVRTINESLAAFWIVTAFFIFTFAFGLGWVLAGHYRELKLAIACNDVCMSAGYDAGAGEQNSCKCSSYTLISPVQSIER